MVDSLSRYVLLEFKERDGIVVSVQEKTVLELGKKEEFVDIHTNAEFICNIPNPTNRRKTTRVNATILLHSGIIYHLNVFQ